MNYYFISADVALTLMVLQQSGDFAPSSVMTYKYFVLAPETFTENLAESAKQLFYQIYDEHYDAFKIKEPNDPNYIAVVDVTPQILNPQDYADQPWLTVRPPVWENSHCIVVQNNSYQKIDPNSLGGILGIA
jgi:hypothetical protein